MSEGSPAPDATYVRFQDCAADLARARGTATAAVFEPIGLILLRDHSHQEYFCTPLNSVTFATTGGDGVHFGFLQVEHRPRMPIVMTVPMSDAYNLVIAEDFHEFLQLGYHAGYFSLEQFVHDPEWAARFHSREDPEMDAAQKSLLAHLREEFQLKPLPDIGGRVREVHRTYAQSVRLPDFEDWTRKHGA
jgi:hypothetical protein